MINAYFEGNNSVIDQLRSYWHEDGQVQKLHDEFIENTISNFYLPLGVAPNFKINGKFYCIPMAIEESSVVAAAAKSASFWLERGGFKTEVINSNKVGHVHFIWKGAKTTLTNWFDSNKDLFLQGTEDLTANMRARGGGIIGLELVDKCDLEDGYFQLKAEFNTKDAMGANFINSCLEEFSKILEAGIGGDNQLEVIMCILSNYTPDCLVRAEVSCPVDQLNVDPEISPKEFASKFERALKIATVEPYRATTHNKGIMNGIDAVILATGNDFRAVEACAHTYASRDGQYRSLTHAEVKDGIFRFWIEIPMAVGTVGGLTTLHPMVRFCHDLLGNPNAEELMQIIACAGLAQNFGAVRSLVTTGIQKGHMKMHLLNILNQLEATPEEKEIIRKDFETKVVSHKAVVDAFCALRGIKSPSEVKK